MLSKETLNTYVSIINRLKLFKINLDDIDNLNFDYLFDIIDNYVEGNNSSFLTCLSSLSWYYKNNNSPKYILDEINNKRKIIKQKVQNEKNNNLLSNNEERNITNWETVVEIYNSLEKLFINNTNNKRINTFYIILSFYLLLPPRRLSDYANLYFLDSYHINDEFVFDSNFQNVSFDKVINYKVNPIIDGNKNYYFEFNNDGYFMFNNYKTSKIYGKQIIKINTKMNNILKHYIQKYRIIANEKIIKNQKNALMNNLQLIFKIYINKNISVDLLRHMYIIFIKKQGLSINQYNYISKLMSHSFNMQGEYFKIVDDNCKVEPLFNANVDDFIKHKL